MGFFGALEAMAMLERFRVRRCFVVVCAVVSWGGAGCASTLSHEETMAEIERLRAAVRQSEERVVAMQAQQAELSQQLRLLSAFVGAMANATAGREADATQKKQGFSGNPTNAVAVPVEPPKTPQSPELEF